MSDLGIGVGSQLGAYRLERRLGAGSTSEVYLAVHSEIGRRVAVKVLAPELVVDAEIFGRFVEEARIVNAVQNEHIVEIYDVLRSDAPRIVAFVMELVQGPSLKALAPHRLSPEQSTGVALQLASALRAAHDAGIIHRDLKPDNLLFTTDPRGEPAHVVPRLKVIDFGIAKQVGGPARTVIGQMLGTPAYMAPEQIVGDPPSSAASDVYALGEICFEMWTGARAYPQSTTPDCVRAKLRGQPEPFETSILPAAAHARARILVEGTLAHEPKDRPDLATVRAELIDIARIVAAGDDAPRAAPTAGAPRVPGADTVRASLGSPAGIAAAITDPLPPPMAVPLTFDEPTAPPRRARIALAPTEPGARAPEPPTEEGLATIREEAATDESLPVVATPGVLASIPVVVSDTVLRVPSPTKKHPGSYESLGVLLQTPPDSVSVPAAVPTPTPSRAPAMPLAEPVSHRRSRRKLSGAWLVAMLLLAVAVGLLAVVIVTRPG